jgi:hypothetical protein
MNESGELIDRPIAEAVAYDPATLSWLGQDVPPPRAPAVFRPPAPSDPPLMDFEPPAWIGGVISELPRIIVY